MIAPQTCLIYLPKVKRIVINVKSSLMNSYFRRCDSRGKKLFSSNIHVDTKQDLQKLESFRSAQSLKSLYFEYILINP